MSIKNVGRALLYIFVWVIFNFLVLYAILNYVAFIHRTMLKGGMFESLTPLFFFLCLFASCYGCVISFVYLLKRFRGKIHAKKKKKIRHVRH